MDKSLTYRVTLRRNRDGRVVSFPTEWDDPDSIRFYWEEGNMACDCNRHILFMKAIGEDPGEDPPCGDERYSLLSLEVGTSGGQ